MFDEFWNVDPNRASSDTFWSLTLKASTGLRHSLVLIESKRDFIEVPDPL
jgi:hypothetical protein